MREYNSALTEVLFKKHLCKGKTKLLHTISCSRVFSNTGFPKSRALHFLDCGHRRDKGSVIFFIFILFTNYRLQ